jgi:DNA-binding beta-propeller fold protein YncE
MIKFFKILSLFILLSPVLLASAQDPAEAPQLSLHFLATWTGESGGNTAMKEPNAVSVDPSGNVYVADTGNQRILKFNPLGLITAQIGGFGRGTDQFDGPVSVWAQNGLDVLVADMNNQRVVRCDRGLHFISSLEQGDSWPDAFRFGFPLDAALGMQSELYCLDGENRRVVKLDVMGNPQIAFGGFDAGEGRLDKPSRFFITRDNRILVSDEGSGTVKTFDMHGNFLFSFGSGLFEKPMGLCEPDDGWLLVADAAQRRVFTFKTYRPFDGTVFDGPPFAEPVDAASWKNRVFVLDKKRACLDLFEWTYRP